MNPTDLPDLSKPKTSKPNRRKTKIQVNSFESIRFFYDYRIFLVDPVHVWHTHTHYLSFLSDHGVAGGQGLTSPKTPQISLKLTPPQKKPIEKQKNNNKTCFCFNRSLELKAISGVFWEVVSLRKKAWRPTTATKNSKHQHVHYFSKKDFLCSDSPANKTTRWSNTPFGTIFSLREVYGEFWRKGWMPCE